MSEEKTQLKLAHEHQLEVSEKGGSLVLKQGQNTVMTIELTEKGPRLKFDTPNLAIHNSGSLEFEAEHIHMKARGNFVQEVQGDVIQSTSGNQHLKVGGDTFVESQALRMEAKTGSMSLKANDDLALDGLRILHNVPTEEELREQYRKVKTFGDLLSAPAFNADSPRRLAWGQPKGE